jgi:protein-S-isoprenylcysteine O-methyltransferase Ste14
VNVTRWLARWRVTLGFLLAALVLWLASPTWPSWAMGGAIALAGEALRIWAAGHLEKSREVTRSGPYRILRHPLYAGSALIGVGFAVASWHPAAALAITLYLAFTLDAARRSEEAHLRAKFGDAYPAYAEGRAAPMDRRFSASRALANREHHAVAGLVAGLAALAWKAWN